VPRAIVSLQVVQHVNRDQQRNNYWLTHAKLLLNQTIGKLRHPTQSVRQHPLLPSTLLVFESDEWRCTKMMCTNLNNIVFSNGRCELSQNTLMISGDNKRNTLIRFRCRLPVLRLNDGQTHIPLFVDIGMVYFGNKCNLWRLERILRREVYLNFERAPVIRLLFLKETYSSVFIRHLSEDILQFL